MKVGKLELSVVLLTVPYLLGRAIQWAMGTTSSGSGHMPSVDGLIAVIILILGALVLRFGTILGVLALGLAWSLGRVQTIRAVIFGIVYISLAALGWLVIEIPH